MIWLRSHFPSLYRFAACTALLAMLVPVGTGLVHHAPLRLCGVAPQANNNPDKNPTHKAPFCPICQTLHMLGGGFVPPGSTVVAAVFVPAAVYVVADFDFLPGPRPASQAQPRAPPVLV